MKLTDSSPPPCGTAQTICLHYDYRGVAGVGIMSTCVHVPFNDRAALDAATAPYLHIGRQRRGPSDASQRLWAACKDFVFVPPGVECAKTKFRGASAAGETRTKPGICHVV